VKTVPEVVARLKRIEADLSPDDGAAVFNHMYLAITGDVASGLDSAHVFRNPAFMAALDVTFAKFWLEAYDASADALPKAWAPLFERRHDRSLLPIQFALAGMNAHIAHDLPVALVRTCRRLDVAPDDPAVHADYEKVNSLLAAKESEIRRSFLTDVGRRADKTVGPVVHLIDAWNIDKAREVSWVNAEALWAMRHMGALADRYVAALARTVGMASRCLLTPVLSATR
jgi:Family of unknown function (DUF5995)